MPQFSELNLLPGAAIRLTVPGVSDKQAAAQGKYMGTDWSRAIIAAIQLPVEFQAGGKVAVSMTSPTGIVTFPSQIEAICALPIPHVFLQYPKAVSLRSVRSAVRVSVEVLAQIANLCSDDALEMRPAQITDISVKGVGLASQTVLGNIGDEIAIHMPITLDDIVRDIMLTGIIRTRTKTARGECCGVEFTQLDENKRVLLYAYVFNMIQRHGPQT